MPTFSRASLSRLRTCDPRLQALFREVVLRFDCAILEGVRSDERQADLYHQGKSKLDGVRQRSKHQAGPDGLSRAVDVAPYPIDWNVNKKAVSDRWLDFARVVLEVADEQGVSVRWGGDWDCDWSRKTDPRHDVGQRFNDWPHWELR
jgi:peptidoglycan L-alanyl-D-glutamate endopeptidase CwlK